MIPRLTLAAFDTWLVSRSLRFDAIVVGGSALALLGVTDRPTRDVDILYPALPDDVTRAAREFAEDCRRHGMTISDSWLNNGPMQLTEVLPDGWQQRVVPAFEGQALVLMTLGRGDLLRTKLFALCDRGSDWVDCLAMGPSSEEINDALAWVADQDAHPGWPDHVRVTLTELRRRLGYGI